MSSRPSSTASSRASWPSRSSTAYPVRVSSGSTATATPSADSCRATSMTLAALRAGSATYTSVVQAATRANPWAYSEEKLMRSSCPTGRRSPEPRQSSESPTASLPLSSSGGFGFSTPATLSAKAGSSPAPVASSSIESVAATFLTAARASSIASWARSSCVVSTWTVLGSGSGASPALSPDLMNGSVSLDGSAVSLGDSSIWLCDSSVWLSSSPAGRRRARPQGVSWRHSSPRAVERIRRRDRLAAMRVLVISDTHAPRFWKRCPPAVAAYAEGADLILHAGDVCIPEVLDELSQFAPVRVVLGNNDGPEVAAWGAPETARARAGRPADRDDPRRRLQGRTAGSDATSVPQLPRGDLRPLAHPVGRRR